MATTAPSLTPTLPETFIHLSLCCSLSFIASSVLWIPPFLPPSSSSSLVSSQIIHA